MKLEERATSQLQIDEDYVSKEEGLKFMRDLMDGLGKKKPDKPVDDYEDILF